MSFVKKLSAVLLLVSSAQAQFGPASSSVSTSLGSAPTESIGCRVVDGQWECAAPRTAAASSTSAAEVSSSAVTNASETPSSATPTATSDVPGPPAESTGCVAHGDHYHCEGPAEGHEDQTATSTAEPSIPSPTESSNCIWRKSAYQTYEDSIAHLYQTSVTGTVSARRQKQKRRRAQTILESVSSMASRSQSFQELRIDDPVGHSHGDCSAEQMACGVVLTENYNMGLHVGAVFIVLVTSGLAVMIPLISSWLRKSEQVDMDGFDSAANFGRKTGWWGNIFFIARHFGTGIIISTAFIVSNRFLEVLSLMTNDPASIIPRVRYVRERMCRSPSLRVHSSSYRHGRGISHVPSRLFGVSYSPPQIQRSSIGVTTLIRER